MLSTLRCEAPFASGRVNNSQEAWRCFGHLRRWLVFDHSGRTSQKGPNPIRSGRLKGLVYRLKRGASRGLALPFGQFANACGKHTGAHNEDTLLPVQGV